MQNFLEKLLENLDEINSYDFSDFSYGGNSIPSLTITSSKKKKVTKSVSFTKALSEKLDLTDSIEILFLKKGSIVVGDHLGIEQAKKFSLCDDDGKKIIYNANLVQILTTLGNLDYSERTSYSFREIKYDDVDGKTVATIDLTSPVISQHRKRKVSESV